MKAKIYINRHIIQANKKASKELGIVIDNPAIVIKTYKETVYAKEVFLAPGVKLIQDAANAICSGATIWIETEFENIQILSRSCNS
jgi:hypothetical protein